MLTTAVGVPRIVTDVFLTPFTVRSDEEECGVDSSLGDPSILHHLPMVESQPTMALARRDPL